MPSRPGIIAAVVVLSAIVVTNATAFEPIGKLRAGVSNIDVTPPKFPVVVNGMFEERSAASAHDPVRARTIVLDDGATRLAIVIVDSLMLPRELLDRVKDRASAKSGLRSDHILIAATHTHSAPSAMGALGSRPDPHYPPFLEDRLVEGIIQAAGNLRPARAGWGTVDAPNHTHCRQWIRRPDRILVDPFGKKTVRANMHPGYQSPDVIGPTGPADPGLSLLSIQTEDGRPLAVLANYSMHYFDSTPVSADYFGMFGRAMTQRITALDPSRALDPAFVAIMSQGTSGDAHWMDYGKPKTNIDITRYSSELADIAMSSYKRITYQEAVPLAMRESTITVRRRVPDAERLAEARKVAASIGNRLPRGLREIYALEQVAISEEPQRTLKLQAIRIGDLGIAAIPNEVFSLTGLHIKAQSPLTPTFTIELANGADGYIPPANLHPMGGYTTWPARTAGLEAGAESKIVGAILSILEAVSGKPRFTAVEPFGAAVRAVLDMKPYALWRLGEFDGPAYDASGNGRTADFVGPVAYYLDGLPSEDIAGPGEINRAVHLVEGRLEAAIDRPSDQISVGLWVWNGFADRKALILAATAGESPVLPTLSIDAGKLVVESGDSSFRGRSTIPLKTWTHLLLVKDGDRIVSYVNGKEDGSGSIKNGPVPKFVLSVGGQAGRSEHLEGKIDEVVVFDRALTSGDAAKLVP